MADLDRIKERIRQLREMTEARGCTEAEAMQAAGYLTADQIFDANRI